MSDVTAIVHALTEGDDGFDVKELDPEPLSIEKVRHQGVLWIYADRPGNFREHVGSVEPVPSGYRVAYARNHGILRRMDPALDIVFPTEDQAVNAVLQDFIGTKNLKEGEEDFDVKEVGPEPAPKFEFRLNQTKAGLDNFRYDVFVNDKWIGRILRDYDGKHWLANWMPDAEGHPQPERFSSPQEAAQWLWDHRVHMLRQQGVAEAAEDDEEGMGEMNVNIGLYVGARVRVLTGDYQGEAGTVVGKTSFGTQKRGEHSFWVHLDGHEDDPSAAISYRADQLQVIGDVGYPPGMRVRITAGRYAGVKGFVTGADRTKQVVYVHPDTMEDEWGTVPVPLKDVVELSEVDEARELVAEVAEDDDDIMKELGYDALTMSAQALQQAGFEVLQAERIEDEWFLKFKWPIVGVTTAVNGAKRAKEILAPYMRLDPHHYTINYDKTGDTRFATVFIRRTAEEDPGLWKIIPPESKSYQGFYKVLYSGQPVGEFYATQAGAERLRDELVNLHKISEFPLQRPGLGWNDPENLKKSDTAWATGPAMAWWKVNRKRLTKEQRAGGVLLDKFLLGEE